MRLYQTKFKVICFDGWNGFAACAVLRSIAELLPSMRTNPKLCFDSIILVVCSKWKNIRAVQGAVVEELKLDSLEYLFVHTLSRILREDIDGAREGIFSFMRPPYHNRKVIYFDGWNGFGASAVLISIAEVLRSRRATPEVFFDNIIHVDCSKWKNRRAVQRAIVEEIKLDSSVLAILDKQDEEDDFNGVEESSRNEVPDVSRKIYDILKISRFVIIFHNGSDSMFEFSSLGVPPLMEFTDNHMIWTFTRMELKSYKERAQKVNYTQLLLYEEMNDQSSEEFYALLCKKADIIVSSYTGMQGINPSMVVDIFLYQLFLHCNFHRTTTYSWAGHASNYWICDGIMDEDIVKEISNTLHWIYDWIMDEDIASNIKKFIKPHSFLVIKDDANYQMEPCRRISITSRNLRTQTIPGETISLFLALERSSDSSLAIPNGLFGHSNNIRVIILSFCAFNFASPPFLHCHTLKFLGLDHCKDNKTRQRKCHKEWVCLKGLWVLDLRYTDWDDILSEEKMDLMTNLKELDIEGLWCFQHITLLQRQVPYIQRLRITKPSCGLKASTDISSFFLDKTKLEILDLSGNDEMRILPSSLAKASSLEVLVLDGCSGLENVVVPAGLPHSLRSFSLDGYGSASQWTPTVDLPPEHLRPSTPKDKKDANVSKISLKGCKTLQNLFLRRLPNLMELDLSGTAIKILDFEIMVVEVPRLKRLFLLGCEHLCAIRWGHNLDDIEHNLELLCIDTRAEIRCHRACLDQIKHFRLHVHAVVTDVRLVRSINLLRSSDVSFNIHVTSSPVYSWIDQVESTRKEKIGHRDQLSQPQVVSAGPYDDVFRIVGNTPMQDFPQPPTSRLDQHMEIAQGSRSLESELHGNLGYVMGYTKSLHMHDVWTSACIPSGIWSELRWCIVERCPKLETVFHRHEATDFPSLTTIWISDLRMARWINSHVVYPSSPCINLRHLHLRSCPGLQRAPTPALLRSCPGFPSFPSLETLHIIHCGDLRHIFVKMDQDEIALFPKLTRIHLHDLPMLQQICDVKMAAPALESIKIRGCWGLRRLPARGGDAKKPTVEIEKDVWDALEWDGVEADHHPDRFEAPVHSRYYKQKLPRASVLR